MGMQIAAAAGALVAIAVDAVDGWHVCYPVERDFEVGVKAAPFGLSRMPGRSRVHGRSAELAGISPGAAPIRRFAAIGSKSGRKCTELLLTRIFCSVGSMPT